MFGTLTTKINDNITLILKENEADIFFIRTLIRFFDKQETLFKISMEENYNQDNVDEFKRYFLYDVYNGDLLSDKEIEKLGNIIFMMIYTIKDDIVVNLKEIS